MKPYDLDAFERFMGELADCYGRQPYTTGALKHWAEALQDFEWRQVKAKLSVWRDSNPRPPQVGDILPSLKQVRDFERIRGEQKAPELPTPVNAHGEACLAKLKAILAHPAKPNKAWAYQLRDQHRTGKQLYTLQMEMAKKACGVDWETDRPFRGDPVKVRTPGEDDE